MLSRGFATVGYDLLRNPKSVNNFELLRVENLSFAFSGLQALSSVGLSVHRQEVVGIVGSNGSGKTTLFNLISRFYKPQAGTIFFDGKDVTRLDSHEVSCAGVARSFQTPRLFDGLTVAENVEIALRGLVGRRGVLAALRQRRMESPTIVNPLLESLQLIEMRERLAAELSYGMRRRLELARCLALEPKLLLLDEPAAGLNSHESEELVDTLLGLRSKLGVSMVVIDHDMLFIQRVCDRIIVLNRGVVVAEGDFQTIFSNQATAGTYLGRN